MKRALLPILVLALLLGTALVILAPSGDDGTQPKSPTTQTESKTEVDVTVLTTSDGTERVVERVLLPRVEDTGLFIEGRVAVPSGAGLSPVTVVALSPDLGLPEALRRLYAIADGAEEAEPALAAVEAERDGTFRLGLPEGTELVRLAAVGDRCWSPAPSLVVAGTSDARVSCQLGGSITGVVQSPTGGRAVSGQIRLAVRRTYATRVLPSYRIRPRSVTVDEDGRFRFAAVPVTDGLRLEVRADELAGTSVDLTPLAPGEERELEIRLPKGVRVEGRVEDDEGLAIAGATFAILQAEPLGLPGAVLQSVDTDADGRFEFAQVRPEDVVGGLSAEGFASRLIDLEIRETSTEIDLGPLRLSRAETLEGRVLLPAGAPAVGATVKAERDQQQSNAEGFEEAWSESTGEAVTDESGRFEISGLEGQVFQLDVELEDGSDTWRSRVRGVQSREWLEIRLEPSIVASGAVRDVEGRPIEDFVLTFESARSGQFDVSSSERRTAEFTASGGVWEFDGLLPGRWLLQAQSPGFAVGEPTEVELPTTEPIQLVLQPAGRVSGTVLDPRGRPISGAFVRPDEPWFEALRRGPRITTTTADDGTFVLDGLESGDVPLIAEHERYVASEPIVVEVPLGGEVSDLVVELRQGGSLRGRAYTREGEPSAGGQIMLVHASEVRPITRPLDPEGRFEIVRIEPGSYQAVSFPDLSNELTDGNDDSLTSRMLTEAVTELIEIREGEVTELVLGSPLSDPVRVSGQVRAGGIGSQYSLTFLPESDVGGFERMRQLRTDSAGRYDLVLHEPGNFVISVTRGLAPSPRISEQTFLRTIPDTDEYRLDFDLPVTSLGGRVVDLEGLPLIGVPVRAASVEGSTYASLVGLASASTVTDENGRYVFELLPPGTYSVQAGGPGSAISRSVDDTRGASVAPEVVLTEGAQIDDLDFELSTGLSLRGIVLDAAGDPVRQANVFVRNEDGHSLESLSTLQTDATGAFQVRGLGGGLHSLMARKGALATPIVTGIEARPDAPAVELRLGPATDLIVRVDVDGELDPGARVIVEDEAGQPVSALSSLEEEVRRLNAFRSDEFRFGPLPPGRYRVIARASDGRVEDRRVDLRGQAERRLRLRLD